MDNREEIALWKEEKRRKLLSFGQDHKGARNEIESIKEELTLESEKIRNGFKKLNLRDNGFLLGAALQPVQAKEQALADILREVIDQYDFEPTLARKVNQQVFDDPYGYKKLSYAITAFFSGAFLSFLLLDILGIGGFLDNALGIPPNERERLIHPYHVPLHFIAGGLCAWRLTYRVFKPKILLVSGAALFALLLITSFVVRKPLLLVMYDDMRRSKGLIPTGKFEAAPPTQPSAAPTVQIALATSTQTTPAPSAQPTSTPTPQPTATVVDTYLEWARKEFQKAIDSKIIEFGGKYYVKVTPRSGLLKNRPWDNLEEILLVEMPDLNIGVGTGYKEPLDDANGIVWRGGGSFKPSHVRWWKLQGGWRCFEDTGNDITHRFTRRKNGTSEVMGSLDGDYFIKPTVEEIRRALTDPPSSNCR